MGWLCDPKPGQAAVVSLDCCNEEFSTSSESACFGLLSVKKRFLGVLLCPRKVTLNLSTLTDSKCQVFNILFGQERAFSNGSK